MLYHIARNGQQQGSFSEPEIRSRIENGEFHPSDLCWTEGMSDWQPIGQILPALPIAGAAPVIEPVQTVNPYAPPSADVTPWQRKTRPPAASLGQRLGAALLDSLVVFITMIPFIIGAGLMENPEGNAEPPAAALLAMGIGGLLLLILMIYTLVLLSTQGQTVGKKMLGIRIVGNDDDSQAGFVRAVLLRVFVNALRVFVNALLGFIPFYGLIDLCFIFGQERRCLHDLIAGTRVIQG